MIEIIHHFFLTEPQSTISWFTVLLWVISVAIGRLMKCPIAEAGAFGFLILIGSTTFFFVIARATGIPTVLFGYISLAIAFSIGFAFRHYVFANRVKSQKFDPLFLLLISPPLIALFVINMIQPDPSAALSALHAWHPLYIEKSFEIGRFLLPKEMAAGFEDGLVMEVYYLLELIGIVAFGGWIGLEQVYPAYHAASMLAAMLGFVVLANALRSNRFALMMFSAFTLITLRQDDFYRLLLGYNWFEAPIYLGGALICYYLVKGRNTHEALLGAAGASIFLVFGRHYGAFFSAFLIIGGFISYVIIQKKRHVGKWLWSWFLIGAMLTLFTAREFYFLYDPPSRFYPGTAFLESRIVDPGGMLIGTLNSFGILTHGALPDSIIGVRSLYIIALAALLFTYRKKWPAQKFRFAVYLSPLSVLFLPLLLQVFTGYRTEVDMSKPFVLGIFLFSWYPCYAASQIIRGRFSAQMPPKVLIAVLAGVLLIVAVAVAPVANRIKNHPLIVKPFGEYLAWAFQTYRLTNYDMQIANKLKKKFPLKIEKIIQTPVLYFHTEPGLSLRLFLGGEFFDDIDYWSEAAAKHFSDSNNLCNCPGRAA